MSQSSGGSNYSVFGLGDLIESYGASFDAVGGASIGATSPFAVNLANPAAWNAPRSTRFQTGFTFRQFRNTDQSGSSAQNGGYLQGFASVFSIDTVRGISAGFGIIPKTHVQYSYRLISNTDDPSQSMSVVFRGTGGMSSLYVGSAVQVLPNVHLGVMGEYNFGNIEATVQTDATSTLSQSRTIITDALSGVSGKIGLQYLGIPNLALGFVAGAGIPLTITRNVTYKFSGALQDETLLDTITTAFPTELAFGIGYTLNRLTFLADVSTKDFSTFRYRARRDDVVFRPSTRISLGVALAGSSDYTASFFEALGYSIGFGYHEQYLRISGIGINEIYGSFGLQLPVVRRVIFDVAVTGGLRGVHTQGLTQELFGRFSFSVNVGEIWFQPLFRE
ncbi:MAG: hypothetical protein RML40_05875 [Bacteroidota bacterium]|nr:hypothetical protein [Bacteroidota bacterium]